LEDRGKITYCCCPTTQKKKQTSPQRTKKTPQIKSLPSNL